MNPPAGNRTIALPLVTAATTIPGAEWLLPFRGELRRGRNWRSRSAPGTCVVAAQLLFVATLSSFALEPNPTFTVKPFAQLSEKNVSQRGADALAMKSVNWQHGETDHFVLHTEQGFSAPQLASAVENYYRAMKNDLGIEQDNFERKSHIYIFLNETAWRQFARGTRLEDWTGGFCTGRELFLQARAHFSFQGHTLPHELAHLTVHRFLPGDMPLWLNEGFAEFEATRLYRSYLKVRNYTLRGLSTRVPVERYVPLSELTRSIDYPRDAERVKAFYYESERLVHFLYHELGGREPFLKFMKLQCQGLTFESAMREAYREKFPTLEEFEKRFKTYATKEQE